MVWQETDLVPEHGDISLELLPEKNPYGSTSLLSALKLPTNFYFHFFPFSGVVAFLILIYGLTIAASSYGNSLVLWIVSTTKSLQNVNNLLIANLALSDITIALLCTPFQFYAALAQKWELPEIMCKICPFVQCICVNVNTFNLVLIAQDR